MSKQKLTQPFSHSLLPTPYSLFPTFPLPKNTPKTPQLCTTKNSHLKINNIKQLSKFTHIITCISLKYFISLQIKILIHTNNESETICQMGRR